MGSGRDFEKIISDDLLEEKNYDFEIELKESFLSDLLELEKCSHISREDFKKEFSELLNEVNNTLMKKGNEKKKNVIYKKYKGKYFINVNGDTYKFQFFYSKKHHKLVFEYFDKIMESKEVAKDIDLLIWFCELIFMILFYKNLETKSSVFNTSIIFIMVNIILFIVVESMQKNEKIIWVNSKSFDYYRKWFRCRNVSELSKIYYLVSWINLWIFSLLILATTTLFITEVDKGRILISLLLLIYSINYLFKMYRLKIIYSLPMLVLLLIIGYLNKEVWSFIALIFVIINQLFSEDVIYLSNELSNEQRRKIEKYMATQKGKERTIKLKFKINIIISFSYLFIMIFDTSRFIDPLFSNLIVEKIWNAIPNLFVLAVERMIILAIIFLLLKVNFGIVVNFRRGVIDKVQIIINYISEKQFNELNYLEYTLKEDKQIKYEKKIDEINADELSI